MGRNNTGAWTTKECLQISLSFLLKQGYIQKGCLIRGVLSWNSGGNIIIETDFREGNSKLRLTYSNSKKNGEKTNYDYCIQIAKVPSNLGKGDVLYFICPVSSKRCKILYNAYGCGIWKCREAYSNRIYYPLQLSSQRNRYNDKYWHIESELKKLSEMRQTYTYMGKPTRRAMRQEGLENEQIRVDRLRWSFDNLPVYLQKVLQRSGTNVFQ